MYNGVASYINQCWVSHIIVFVAMEMLYSMVTITVYIQGANNIVLLYYMGGWCLALGVLYTVMDS